jgi:hypothetical protein
LFISTTVAKRPACVKTLAVQFIEEEKSRAFGPAESGELQNSRLKAINEDAKQIEGHTVV